MCRRGVLPLDGAAYRLLDRVDTSYSPDELAELAAVENARMKTTKEDNS